MYKLFLEILSALLTVGGTGMINYLISKVTIGQKGGD